jgi:hypothetical protein
MLHDADQPVISAVCYFSILVNAVNATVVPRYREYKICRHSWLGM